MAGDSPKPRLRLASSVPVQAGALVAGVGLLTAIYTAVNRDLTGGRLLIALALGAGAIFLSVEAFYRRSDDHPSDRWRLIGGAGAGIAVASLLVALLPSSQNSAGAAGQGLRIALQPTAPELFHLAFDKQLSLPSADEGWKELRREGGIDVDSSRFRMVLTNESADPVTVFNVHAEVVGSEEMPHGTYAWAYSQGSEGLDHLFAVLPDGRRGSIGRIYSASLAGRVESLDEEVPYFHEEYVSLEPGEVFPTTLTIEAETPRTIEYRLVAEGESASRKFRVESDPQKIVGRFEDPYQQDFARYYQYQHDPHDCTPHPQNPWVDARDTSRSLACPFGLGHSYEVVPPSAAKYPRGRLDLSVRLGRGQQSVEVSGVKVASAPAAAPVPGVVRPLLQALGAWSSCSVFLPSTSSWTADWEPWGLSMIFTADGSPTDCTPRSPASVREIKLSGSEGAVGTDLGQIELGASELQVPAAIRRIAEPAEAYEGEEDFLVPGASPCDPGHVDEGRYRIFGEGQGGILAWSEPTPAAGIDEVAVTLPDGAC
jgi:hypothetical protein